ncbi:hypothetical protein BH18CHL1_BH18CHL1_00830 [soil metagenome]
MTLHRGVGAHTRLASSILAALWLAIWPMVAMGHAQLVESEPAAGTTVAGPPETVSATFDEALDAGRSRLQLLDASGVVVAEGGVDAEDGTSMTLALVPLALDEGTYEVRWLARTPDDGAIERGRYTFAVAATEPGASPTVVPSPTTETSPTAAASPTTQASPSTGASPTSGASDLPSARPSDAPTTLPTGSAGPARSSGPSPSPGPPTGSGDTGGDPVVPLLALGAVLSAAVVLLLRRPR